MLTDKLIQAIGWTLIHSLWQGLLLAIIIGFIIQFTKRTGPVLRYNLLLGSFFVFLLTCLTTFFVELGSVRSIAEHSAAVIAQTSPGIIISVPEQQFTMVNQLIGYLNNNLPLIVTIWFILLSIKSVHFFFNVAQLQKMRKHNNYPAADWDERLTILAKKLGLAQKVSLRESVMVKIPVVIGFFKPVILFPVGFLANLPADQVEAILLHELAHIRRKDYLVNMIQCIAEMIFFFNPAVLWISSLLREERENCCDDMAISITHKRSEFIHALVSFYENTASTKYVVQFPGQKYQLLNRVKRIMYRNNKVMSAGEKIFFAISLFIIVFLMFGFNDKYQHKQQKTFVKTVLPFAITKEQQKPVVTTTPKKDSILVKKIYKAKPVVTSKKEAQKEFDPKDLEAIYDDYLDHKYSFADQDLKPRRELSNNNNSKDFKFSSQVKTDVNVQLNTEANKGTMGMAKPAQPEAPPVKDAPPGKKKADGPNGNLFGHDKDNVFKKSTKLFHDFNEQMNKKAADIEWKIKNKEWEIEKQKEQFREKQESIREEIQKKRQDDKEKRKTRKGDQKSDLEFRIV